VILYIHGFGSSGQGGKAEKFRRYFRDRGIPFIAPSLSYVPELAMTTLEELIGSYEKVSLIGSSLGGYYATYLAQKYNLSAVLINPAVDSSKSLAYATEKLGEAPNYYDESYFSWQPSHLKMLEAYRLQEPPPQHYFVMLQSGDSVLDYHDALAKYPQSRLLIEEGGSHSFEGIEQHFLEIEEFLCE